MQQVRMAGAMCGAQGLGSRMDQDACSSMARGAAFKNAVSTDSKVRAQEALHAAP